jgi:hypothetical protein
MRTRSWLGRESFAIDHLAASLALAAFLARLALYAMPMVNSAEGVTWWGSHSSSGLDTHPSVDLVVYCVSIALRAGTCLVFVAYLLAITRRSWAWHCLIAAGAYQLVVGLLQVATYTYNNYVYSVDGYLSWKGFPASVLKNIASGVSWTVVGVSLAVFLIRLRREAVEQGCEEEWQWLKTPHAQADVRLTRVTLFACAASFATFTNIHAIFIYYIQKLVPAELIIFEGDFSLWCCFLWQVPTLLWPLAIVYLGLTLRRRLPSDIARTFKLLLLCDVLRCVLLASWIWMSEIDIFRMAWSLIVGCSTVPVITVLAWYWLRGGVNQPERVLTCLQCGYDLTGNASGICPECGTPIVASLGGGLASSGMSDSPPSSNKRGRGTFWFSIMLNVPFIVLYKTVGDQHVAIFVDFCSTLSRRTLVR